MSVPPVPLALHVVSMVQAAQLAPMPLVRSLHLSIHGAVSEHDPREPERVPSDPVTMPDVHSLKSATVHCAIYESCVVLGLCFLQYSAASFAVPRVAVSNH